MFLQVIRGRVPDRTAMRAEHDAWVSEIGATAPGWLGSTAGITEDDRFICLSRFTSGEALTRLAARADARQWRARTERLFLGPVVTAEFLDVALLLDGGTDDAGFVQVVEGRGADAGRLAALQKELLRCLPDGRPDIVGGLAAVGPDGRFVQAFYFSTEELARAGEHGEQLPEVEEILFDLRELAGRATYHDLRHPWLASSPAQAIGARADDGGPPAAARPSRASGGGAARGTGARPQAGAQPWTPADQRAVERGASGRG
jgi:hypothetical protein